MKKRILSGILSIVMVISVLPVGVIIAGAVEGTSKGIFDDSFDAFSEDLANMVNEYDEKETELAESSVEDNEESEFNLKRLIVKTKNQKALDDLGAIAKVEGFWNLHVLQYATEAETESAYNEYSKMSNVECVEPDRVVSIENYEKGKASINTDSEYKSWGAEAMGIAEYKEYLEETVAGDLPLVTVAVIDSGIDADHEMFGGYYDAETNPDGRILKTGKDYFNDDDDPDDDQGHGTHVSGTITELTEDNVKILPIKALGEYSKEDEQKNGITLYIGLLTNICMAMIYAARNADVINMSVGGSDIWMPEFLKTIINEAYKNGVTFVVAAGNDNENAKDFFPAGIEKCITVAAVDETMKRAEFSNYGNIIDVAAPGENILSAKMGGGYISYSGTSMASPHVAALAALLRTKDNSMDARELEVAIKDNVYDLGTEGFDELYGYGFAYAKPGEDFSFIDIDFDKKPGEYANTIELSITSSDADAEIYYTLDGTYPDLNSNVYTGAITIDRTSSVRAIARNKNDRSIFLSGEFYIENTEPRYTIEINNDGTIVGFTGIIPSELTIPAEINGITVKSIGEYAFNACFDVKKVTIPDGVTTIGEGAFFDCSSLTDIEIPDGVTTIGDKAFFYCSRLTHMEIPDSVTTIGNEVFSSCKGLTNIEIPDSVTTIGDEAFSHCLGLTYIEIPDGVTTIGEKAFFDSGLTYIEIPDSVTTIGYKAFGYRSKIITIVSGFEIYGTEDSAAETYATANGLKFIKIDGNTDFTVKFAYTDESGSMITIRTISAGENGSVTPPDAPKVKGYTFTGWESSVEGVTLDDITSDVTFTAQYEKTATYIWNIIISFFSKLLPWNWF